MKYSFFGYGNLAKALVRGLIGTGVRADDITVAAKSGATKETARSEGLNVAEKISDLALDVLFLATKPTPFRENAAAFAEGFGGTKVVSLMPGMPEEEVSAVFGKPVLTVTPTLGIGLGGDVIAVSDADGFSDVKETLSKLGRVIVCDREKLMKITVAASCGLGFAADILAAYQKNAMALGLSEDECVAIVSSIFTSAAAMPPFDGLAAKVATKGGITEKGIAAMNKTLDETVKSAFDAAREVLKI